MAGLKEIEKWEAEIYRIEESDPVHGGEEGVTNKPTKQLANRTLYLKKLLEAAGQKLNPKTLTATTTNHADATGHTHEIAHGSTTQKGIWQATSDTGLDSEQLVLTAKAGKNLAQQIAQNTLAMQGYIPNSKKSSSISDNSEDKVATSKAAKTAYDKGVEGLNKANELDRTALKNSGTQVLNGLLRSNNPSQGGWSGMQYGANSGFWQIEFHPAPTARENRRGNIFFQDANGTRSYLGIPHFESGDIIAYQSWVNSRIDSRIQGVIKAAPSSLDTLQEFAEALGNDPNFSATVLNKIDENKRAAQAAQNAANAANDNANGRIPNSKKSSAINSTSNDTVATSAAVKTAFDKGAAAQTAAENAQRSANNANNNANGRVAKAGDEMTGDLTIRNANSDWSKVRLFNRSGKEMRMECTPDSDDNFFGVSYRSAQGAGEHSASFPKSGLNKIVAYQDWVNIRIDSRIQSVLNAAPSSLDTLKELADALGNDPNFSRTVLNKIDDNKRAVQAAQTAADSANNNANGRVSKAGDTMTGDLTLPRIFTTSNNRAENLKIGDDVWLGDENIANGLRIKGTKDENQAFIKYGSSPLFGWNGNEWKVGDNLLNHSGQNYLYVNAGDNQYAGLEIRQPHNHNAFFRVESEEDHLKVFHEGNNKNYEIRFPKKSGTVALQGDVAVLTGEIAHGGTIPLPAGFSQNQCTWVASPRHIKDDVTANDLMSFTVYANEHRVVTCLAEGKVSPTSRAQYLIIGIK